MKENLAHALKEFDALMKVQGQAGLSRFASNTYSQMRYDADRARNVLLELMGVDS